jgi:hypothetical protein
MTHKFTADDAGCIFDGIHGQAFNDMRVVELAVLHGYTPSPRLYEGMPDSEFYDAEHPYAVDYLNTLAPDGYTFTWLDGDFVLVADTELE